MSNDIDMKNFRSITRTQIETIARSGGCLDSSMALLLEHMPVLISAIDSQGRVVFASRYHTQLEGVSEDFAELITEHDLFPPSARRQFDDLENVTRNSHDGLHWELSVRHKDGSHHVYQMRRFLIDDLGAAADAADTSALAPVVFNFGINITEQKGADNVLHDHRSLVKYMAFHDPLTGLANRTLLYDRLKKSISRERRNNGRFALMLIDIDNFKEVNRAHGRDVGDRYLKYIAQKLGHAVRDTDTVARISDDQFIIIIEDVVDVDDIELVAKKILAFAAEPVMFANADVAATVSIGISLYPANGSSPDTLLRHVDMAMYQAKQRGKGRFEFYAVGMATPSVSFLLLENDLRKAIDQGDIVLLYQPQVDVKNNTVIGLEALIRWQHASKGLINPVHFIPLAEDTGLIDSLGLWVLREACEKYRDWLALGYDFGRVSVNVSARQFRNESFKQQVYDVLEDTGLPAKYLELELTESSTMENPAEAIETLNCLHQIGLSLAIDDFGTGYSSLMHLRRFPIHKLKIDKSFIETIDSNAQDASTAKSIIDLAHNMSLQVIAEGVERAAQVDWLLSKGCDQVQGYYFAKPLSEAELLRWVRQEGHYVDEEGAVHLN